VDDRRIGAAEFRAREEAWLARVAATHAPWRLPRAKLEALVRRTTGSPILSFERIEGGLSNEVYVCRTTDAAVVVRIARVREPHFEQERWAIEQARSRGIPVPDVLLLAHEPDGDRVLSICVERFVPGTSLGSLARRRGRDDPLVAAIARQAGALLVRLHDAAVGGFGPLDGAGRGPFADWSSALALQVDAEQAKALPEIARGLEVLAARRAVFAAAPARLLHFDYEPGHILVDERTGEIVCVLDFEEVRGGDPAYDLAQWEVFHDVYAPFAPLLEGYLQSATLGPEFHERRLLGEIHYRVSELLRGHIPPPFVTAARHRLASAIDEFEARFA
jgi:aminoglycoside phosphotransferase (APT) family kinase protein